MKAKLIEQFVVDLVKDGNVSGRTIAEHLQQRCDVELSERSIRDHMEKLGLSRIKKSLPGLLKEAKKLLNFLIDEGITHSSVQLGSLISHPCPNKSHQKKGCSPDNSACKGFFGRLKNEMFYNRSWLGVSLEEFCTQLDDYIYWYNEKRIKMSLGGRETS